MDYHNFWNENSKHPHARYVDNNLKCSAGKTSLRVFSTGINICVKPND